jgi:hypothetical protein
MQTSFVFMQSKQTRWYEYVRTVTEGMMAKEVAEKAGFDQSAMTRWKNGMNADPKFVVQFARAYEVRSPVRPRLPSECAARPR